MLMPICFPNCFFFFCSQEFRSCTPVDSREGGLYFSEQNNVGSSVVMPVHHFFTGCGILDVATTNEERRSIEQMIEQNNKSYRKMKDMINNLPNIPRRHSFLLELRKAIQQLLPAHRDLRLTYRVQKGPFGNYEDEVLQTNLDDIQNPHEKARLVERIREISERVYLVLKSEFAKDPNSNDSLPMEVSWTSSSWTARVSAKKKKKKLFQEHLFFFFLV